MTIFTRRKTHEGHYNYSDYLLDCSNDLLDWEEEVMEITEREIQNKEAEVARLEELLYNAKKDLRILKQHRAEQAKPKNRFSVNPFCMTASRKDPDEEGREESGSGQTIYTRRI